MKISKKTDKLTDELIIFSGSKIKFEYDLKILIELSGNHEKLFDDILFTAKYLNGLGKILKTNITSSSNAGGNGKSVSVDEARAKIMDEFKLNMKKLSDMLVDYLMV